MTDESGGPPRDSHTGPSRPDGTSPVVLAGLGVQWAVATLVFIAIGNWVDRRVGSAPFGLLVGVFVGGGGVFYLSIRRFLEAGRRNTRQTDRSASSRRAGQGQDVD